MHMCGIVRRRMSDALFAFLKVEINRVSRETTTTTTKKKCVQFSVANVIARAL